MSAIFALGLIGAGTNNSKIAGNLRFLASYYSAATTENQLFVVRIA
jgi:26S proteasome regulatory subunit N1